MTDYEQILKRIQSDERYRRNVDWGRPRKGHPEGTIRAHIQELEENLTALRSKLSEADYWKLAVLVHTHDTFKADSKRGVSITDPRSHASLARDFLAAYCDDTDLLAMVQYHDEPYALWKQFDARGECSGLRFESLLENIADWNLFLAFLIVDGCTDGKSRQPLVWFFDQIAGKIETLITAEDIL